MRILIGPIGAGLLVMTIIVTWFFPLDRARFLRVRRLLERRQQRAADRLALQEALAPQALPPE
jgi:Na+/melibiose symporter-like transporter